MHFDRVDAVGDRVGDEHHVGPRRGEGTGFVREREAAQAGAAHRDAGRAGKLGRVAFELAVGTAGVVGVFVEGHHGVAEVVRLLDERLAFAIEDEAPDVARAVAGDVETAAVGAELRHARLVELHGVLLVAGARDFAVVERALRHPDPAAGRAHELMREKMRILHAEAGQDDRAFVGFAVAVGVFEKGDVVAVLDVAAGKEGDFHKASRASHHSAGLNL